MTDRSRNAALCVAAFVGAPVVFGAYVLGSYRLALRQGALPLTVFPEWYWFAAFGVCLTGGAAAIHATSLRPAWLRTLFALAYLVLMGVGFLGVHLFIACANGDCL